MTMTTKADINSGEYDALPRPTAINANDGSTVGTEGATTVNHTNGPTVCNAVTRERDVAIQRQDDQGIDNNRRSERQHAPGSEPQQHGTFKPHLLQPLLHWYNTTCNGNQRKEINEQVKFYSTLGNSGKIDYEHEQKDKIEYIYKNGGLEWFFSQFKNYKKPTLAEGFFKRTEPEKDVPTMKGNEHLDHFNRNCDNYVPFIDEPPTPLTKPKKIKKVEPRSSKKQQIERKIKAEKDKRIPTPKDNKPTEPLEPEDESDQPPSDPEQIRIGYRDEPEEDEPGRPFVIPDKILVETQPWIPVTWKCMQVTLFAYRAYNILKSFYHDFDWFDNLKPGCFNYAVYLLAAKICWRFATTAYAAQQSYYLQPMLNTYLVPKPKQVDIVQRHERNQITTSTEQGITNYVYQQEIELPSKHWIFNIPRMLITCAVWLDKKQENYTGRRFLNNNYELPRQVVVPAYLRTFMHSRYYEVKNGILKPKVLKINKDLLQRVLTTKALNYHQPVEQQMKTMTALINNQSDINLSTKDISESTVADTLTFTKHMILKNTIRNAEMGFDQASVSLSTSMVTDITRSNPDRGHRYLHRPKRPLEFDPPDTSIVASTVTALSSVILALLIGFLAYRIQTFRIPSLRFWEKLRDLPSKSPRLNLELENYLKEHYITESLFKPGSERIRFPDPTPTEDFGGIMDIFWVRAIYDLVDSASVAIFKEHLDPTNRDNIGFIIFGVVGHVVLGSMMLLPTLLLYRH